MFNTENNSFEILGRALLEISNVFAENPQLKKAKTEKEFNKIVKKGLKR